MRKRNKELASMCELMIAYVGADKSGSAQTVRMAKALGKEIINLYDSLNNA
jgi:predicted Rossmann fold nucleotide-binding protein DprA/Smf involved in DNA uptake